LERIDGERRVSVRETTTNADGRTDRPLIDGSEFRPGSYALVFEIGAYFRRTAGTDAPAPFFDVVTIEITVAETGRHYHVPLLATPWAYSTYRGS
jgi:5-hydroxyisourate hydrolase